MCVYKRNMHVHTKFMIAPQTLTHSISINSEHSVGHARGTKCLNLTKTSHVIHSFTHRLKTKTLIGFQDA